MRKWPIQISRNFTVQIALKYINEDGTSKQKYILTSIEIFLLHLAVFSQYIGKNFKSQRSCIEEMVDAITPL